MFSRNRKDHSRKVARPDRSKKPSPYSYHANRSTDSGKSNRDKEKVERSISTPSLFWNHVTTTIIILVISAVVIDFLWINSKPRIVFIKSASSNVLLQSSATYQSAAEALLGSSFLNHNKLTINVSAISIALEKKFPELSSVTLTLPLGGHQITLYLQAAQPAISLETGDNNTYLLNSGGTVMTVENQDNQEKLASLNLPIVQYLNSLPQINHQVLSTDDVSFATYINSELKAQHITVSSMKIVGSSREIDVLIAGVPYFVKFDLEGNSKEQVGTLVDVQQYLTQNKITPSQYIDVRVPGRAYYK